MDYKTAGVDIEEGYKAVGKYREMAAATMNRAVINDIGSFAGMFSLKELINAGKGMDDPVLVSGTDGVGTKLDIAFKLGKYDTVGIDCVAMCANDILCHGARPLFFLDYLACGKLDAAVAADMVKGVATGCAETGMVLMGGETAEMPGFYDIGKYDIAGFAVGLVDRAAIIDGSTIQDGDVLIGVASSGPHSNGFSLIRKVLPDFNEDFGGQSLGSALLEPTRLYVKPILALMEQVTIHGMAHITGGGFYENIPRMFASPHSAIINDGSWTIPPIFARIASGINDSGLSGAAAQAAGEKLLNEDAELRRKLFSTFNMGIGFVLALAPQDADKVISALDDMGFPAFRIGEIAPLQKDSSSDSTHEGGKAPGAGNVIFRKG
jgi:phosphoribosylformylglycinamidine cyclo-ligase